MKAANNLSPIFKEFLSLLIEEKAEFALVGGWAVAYHGYPRFTGDMVLSFCDIITSLDGVANEEVFSGAVERDFFGLRVPIISKEHLVKNKRATGRTQDLLDLENLQ